jgi:hypothetical protein
VTGKEGYPSLEFDVNPGYDCQILGVSMAHFGTCNDKQIVHMDEIINLVRNSWYKSVEWKLCNEHGNEREDMGVYFNCDGSHIRWPELICPYKHEPMSSKKGYFSSTQLKLCKKMWSVYSV